MSEIQDAARAGARGVADAVKGTIRRPDPGPDAIKLEPSTDVLRIKKIGWSPEGRARARLATAERQVDSRIAELDKLIAERTAGKSWIEQLKDPVLRDLRKARWELTAAKADLRAAREALDGKSPFWKAGLHMFGPPSFGPIKDLAEAERRTNAALAHLEKSEYFVKEAISKLPPRIVFAKDFAGPGEAIKCPGRPDTMRDRLEKLRLEIEWTRSGVQEAREDIWEAQSQKAPPAPRPWPPIWPKFPPYWAELAKK